MKLIFVSAPYSDDSEQKEEIQLARLEAVEKYVKHLMDQGHSAYSPTAALLGIAKKFGMRTDYQFWKEHCHLMVGKSDEFHVLMLDGFVHSEGVADETEQAHENGREVFLVDPVNYEIVNHVDA